MSRKISFRGNIPDGLQDKLSLATIDGKTGYRITKFQTFSMNPGDSEDVELVCKVFMKDQSGSISALVDFTDADLLAVSFYTSSSSAHGSPEDMIVIFDNEVFNQDIFVTATDNSGNTKGTNYYLELETVKLSEVQTTQLTLKNLRAITSRT
jgi:hypothetical protein